MAGAEGNLEFGRRLAGRVGPTPGQAIAWLGAFLAIVLWVWMAADAAGMALVIAVQVAFVVVALWRVALAVASLGPKPVVELPDRLPRYTILAALHDEPAVAAQLVRRLEAIDYPPDRLEGYLLLETGDEATRAALEAARPPPWLRILIVPPGAPKTKPRALNVGLALATGQLATVYDAEDEPHPQQLKEAAARFAADRESRLGCLQAPLRIRPAIGAPHGFLGRQFAVEYASLFEVVLPGLARLHLPFPLGGTSNHFRVEALRGIGGWDPWNVTEDADMGFRLWRAGWRLGVLNSPTWEAPPRDLHDWLPQRTRWLKGFMQTWGVHTREPWRLGPRGFFALVMTLGVSLGSAAVHAPSLALVISAVLVAVHARVAPATPLFAMSVLVLGVAAAWLSGAIGAQRAKTAYTATDMLCSPAYWSLLSLACLHAIWALIQEPFHWDKTRHEPDAHQGHVPDEAGRRAA